MNRLTQKRNCCGFFSDFLTILAGIMYFKDNNQKFFIEWNNKLYSNNEHENLYTKFFKQIYELENIENEYSDKTPYGYYFPEAVSNGLGNKKIYDNLKKPSDILKELDITNSETFNNIDKNYFGGMKVLGVHRRVTDHYLHGVIIPDKI